MESGDFTGIASSLHGLRKQHSTGSNPWATQLTQQLGYTVVGGEPYYFRRLHQYESRHRCSVRRSFPKSTSVPYFVQSHFAELVALHSAS